MADIKIILASKSPRRHALIEELGFPFEIRTKEVEEIYPESLELYSVPEFLADLKAGPLVDTLGTAELLLTSDTIVIHNGKILGKPKGKEDAKNMLRLLSGNMHEVVTGVCLQNRNKKISFSVKTNVHFMDLSKEEIEYYIDNFKPFDKAGSYGIQEWIGFIGVEKIEGCYYNVMGLPVGAVYKAIKNEFGHNQII